MTDAKDWVRRAAICCHHLQGRLDGDHVSDAFTLLGQGIALLRDLPADVAAREAAAWCAGRDAAADRIMPRNPRHDWTWYAETCAEAAYSIRPLTPPASDALSAALAQARREGMLAAAEYLEQHARANLVDRTPVEDHAAAIRKLAEGGS